MQQRANVMEQFTRTVLVRSAEQDRDLPSPLGGAAVIRCGHITLQKRCPARRTTTNDERGLTTTTARTSERLATARLARTCRPSLSSSHRGKASRRGCDNRPRRVGHARRQSCVALHRSRHTTRAASIVGSAERRRRERCGLDRDRDRNGVAVLASYRVQPIASSELSLA